MLRFDPKRAPSPSIVVDLGALRANLAILGRVQQESGAKILLALKGFAMWSVFPVIREYLVGVTASSPDEARLGREEFGGEVHAYAPAYSERDVRELTTTCDHLVFNSPAQWHRLGPIAKQAGVQCGLRINPEHSEVHVALYDPCAPCSRLGTPIASLSDRDIDGLDGLHFHALCQSNSDNLERMVAAVEERFGKYLSRVRWVNFGGGHHVSRPDYDVDRLIRIVRGFSERHGVQVYLEPGEAIALNTGVLIASVLDVVHNQMNVAILDTSATAHMPDVLEMPYRPEIIRAGQSGAAGEPNALPHTYRLGGLTCLAGDVIGDYSFSKPLEIGDRLVFTDMAHYTMVKSTTFNGVRLPSIATYDPESNELKVVRTFGYEDYKNRLG